MRLRVGRGVALAVGAILLAAGLSNCASRGDKFVYENFHQIRPHASNKEEVTALLGEPNHDLGNQWIYERQDKHLHAIIDFDESGKVARKQWVDAMSTEKTWDDSDDRDSGKP